MAESGQKYLLDSQILIWWFLDRNELRRSACIPVIENPDNDIYVSIASTWELRIKQSKGKLDLPNELEDYILEDGFEILPLTVEHIKRMTTLPDIHKDPFDRILIAQSLVENMVLISRDETIAKYDLDVLKA